MTKSKILVGLAVLGMLAGGVQTASAAGKHHANGPKYLRAKIKKLRIHSLRLRSQRNRVHRRLKLIRAERDTALDSARQAEGDRDETSSELDDALGERDDARSERDDLRSQRNQARSERDDATTALRSGLPSQVELIASTSLLPEIKSQVLRPLEAAWPCDGRLSSIFDGEELWSLSLELQVLPFDVGCPYSESL